MTAVPSSMRAVRWLAAAMIATGDEIPGCRCRSRSHTLSKPSASARSITSSVSSIPGPGSASSNRPMVRNPSLRNGSPRLGIRWSPYPLLSRHTTAGPTVVDPAVRVTRSGRDGGRLLHRLQRLCDDLRDVRHGLDLQRVEHLGGNVVEVGLVALRDEHRLQAGPLRGEQLLLHPADGQHPTVERDLTGHADVRADLAPG